MISFIGLSLIIKKILFLSLEYEKDHSYIQSFADVENRRLLRDHLQLFKYDPVVIST